MVTIGTGRDDPRAWVRAAYAILDAAEQADPGRKLPTHAQIAVALGVSRFTTARACQELSCLGLVRLIPGHGYYSTDRHRALPPARRPRLAVPFASGQAVIIRTGISCPIGLPRSVG
jgi:DNA-binding transcriptional MocR family regulator